MVWLPDVELHGSDRRFRSSVSRATEIADEGIDLELREHFSLPITKYHVSIQSVSGLADQRNRELRFIERHCKCKARQVKHRVR